MGSLTINAYRAKMKTTIAPFAIAVRCREALVGSLVEAAKLLESEEFVLPQRIKTVRSGLKCSLALLRLAPEAMQAKAATLRKRLHIVRRNLGVARDAQAVVESLADLKPSGSARRKSADLKLLRQWRARLQLASDDTMQRMTGDQVAREAARLRQIAMALMVGAWTTTHDQPIVDRFRKDYRRARRRRPGRDASEAPEKLHAFRKVAVDHCCQLAFLLPGASERIKSLNSLRRTLGSLQDMEMLKLAILDQPDGPDPDRLMRLIKRRQTKCVEKARRLTHASFDRRPNCVWPSAPIFYQTVVKQSLSRG